MFFPGLDFAWAMGGYMYHTKLDSADYVTLESLQHAGDNILPLTLHMANVNCPQDCQPNGTMVFFDILHLFVFRITSATATRINYFVVASSLAIILWNAYKLSFRGELNLISHPRNYLEFGILFVCAELAAFSWLKTLIWRYNFNLLWGPYYLIACSLITYAGVSRRRYLSGVVKGAGYLLLSWIFTVAVSVFLAASFYSVNRLLSWFTRPIWIYFLYGIPALTIPLSFVVTATKHFKKTVVNIFDDFYCYYVSFLP